MKTPFLDHILNRYGWRMAHEKVFNAFLSILIIFGTLLFLATVNQGIAIYYANKYCALRGYVEVVTDPKLNIYCKRLKDGSDELLLVPYDYRKEHD